MAGIFRADTWTGTETDLIRTALDTRVYWDVLVDFGDFGRYIGFRPIWDLELKKKKVEKETNWSKEQQRVEKESDW